MQNETITLPTWSNLEVETQQGELRKQILDSKDTFFGWRKNLEANAKCQYYNWAFQVPNKGKII